MRDEDTDDAVAAGLNIAELLVMVRKYMGAED